MLINSRKFSRSCRKAKQSFGSKQSTELTIFFVIITRPESALLPSDYFLMRVFFSFFFFLSWNSHFSTLQHFHLVLICISEERNRNGLLPSEIVLCKQER